MFEEENFDSWIEHFKFGVQLKQVLLEIGVLQVPDLVDVFTDADILQQVQSKVNRIEYKKFLRATNTTACLADIVLPEAAKTILMASAVVNTPPLPPTFEHTASMPPKPPTLSTEDVISQRLAEATAKHEAALKESKAMESAARIAVMTTKIRETEAEIRRLEMETVSKKFAADSARVAKDKREEEAVSRLAATRKRRDLINDLHEQLKITASLDMVFLLDCTGSMHSYIAAVKGQITDFVASLGRFYPDIPLRVAFVGYRDHCDGANRVATLSFTGSIPAFQEFVSTQNAYGGGDGPEDVFGGLEEALKLPWQSATRILYHIGDAPCHGTPEFHDWSDDYPGGDPRGLQASDLLSGLKTQNVQYYFGKLLMHTDKMIARFNAIVGGETPFITRTSMSEGTMMDTITGSVMTSMSASLSTSARTDGGHTRMKEVILVAAIPEFTALKPEPAQKYRLKMPASVGELVGALTDRCIEDFPEPALASVKVASFPFAKGAMKAAYYGVDCTSGQVVVLKESMAKSESQLTLAKYEAFLACHHASAYLGAEFNKIKPPGCPRIHFCDVCILHLRSRETQPYMIQEEHITGTFEKYNNNTGMCAPCPSTMGTDHKAVQAFSHWTHEISGGALLVVDCQGCYDGSSRTFNLTDPAVHSTSLTRFGGTNMGKIGMERFFRTHDCNEHCRALGLSAKK